MTEDGLRRIKKLMFENEIFHVVWPRGKKTAGDVRAAKRLASLADKTVCELWNWNYHGEKIFPMIEHELTKRYPGIKFVSYQNFGSIHGAEEARVLSELPDKLKHAGCDAVITAMGC